MIYFLRNGLDGDIKIGYTKTSNILERIRALQTGNPNVIFPLGFINGNRADEKKLHKLFNKHHVVGEWFSPSYEIIEYVFYNCHGFNANNAQTTDNNLHRLEDVERQSIKNRLTKCGGNKSETARQLGITRRTLHKKLKKYGLM